MYVMITDPNERKLLQSNKKIEFVYVLVDDDITNPFDGLVITDPTIKYSFGSSEYCKYCIEHPSRLWEHDLLILFGTLQTLESNDLSIMLIDSNKVKANSNCTIEKGIHQQVHPAKNIFVSILYQDTHYCVVVYNHILKKMYSSMKVGYIYENW